MPGRETPLVTNEIYHVLNRGVASLPTFLDKNDFKRAIETMLYYQNQSPPLKYAKFLELSRERRQRLLGELKREKKVWVEILTYCLMPNHFHFLLKQVVDNGISKFVGQFANSYTRYFNTKHNRTGPLFQGKFKAKRVETEEQFVHLSRYIHLNPYSGGIIKTQKQLADYPFSSLKEFLDTSSFSVCNQEPLMASFKNRQTYREFVFNQADYQRKLELIKHLALEEKSFPR